MHPFGLLLLSLLAGMILFAGGLLVAILLLQHPLRGRVGAQRRQGTARRTRAWPVNVNTRNR